MYPGELIIDENQERVQIISKMLSYKLSLLNSKAELVDELLNYYNDDEESVADSNIMQNDFKDLKFVSYENPYEAYLLTQLKMIELLPSVIDEHIFMLNVGDDIDVVLENFELEVYGVKKDIYSNLKEWDVLLDHVTDERISDIMQNPKGYGDLLLKELCWIRKYEKKYL